MAQSQLEAQPSQDGPALRQVRWLLSRFAEADSADWVAPGEAELRLHFGDGFLTIVTAAKIVQRLAHWAEQLRDELVVLADQPPRVRARVGGLQFEAAAEREPPYRLTGLRVYPVGGTVTDPRVAAPSSLVSGSVPDAAGTIADTAFGELGLVALVLAGAAGDGAAGQSGTPWVLARGWRDLDGDERLRPDHRFPAWSVTKLVTATVVLRLVGDGLIGLDEAANDHLRTVRLADDSVTIRELLSHSGGVDARLNPFADAVPDLAELAGPALSCGGPRGQFSYSNAGYAALGQLIAEVTGMSYADAATRLVLQPLGLTSSSFPASSGAAGADAVSGYELAADGTFTGLPRHVCTMPAAGGLWATAADLVRFALSWSSLLPEALSREALMPVCARSAAVHVGLGWNVNAVRGVAGHRGGGLAGSSSLIVRLGEHRAHVAMTNRRVPIEPVNGQVIRAMRETGDS